MNAVRLSLTLAGILLTATGSRAQWVDYELVPVGNPGNADDTINTGGLHPINYGGVSYEYQIGKYEVTIGQYAAFLNAVAKTDTYSLYSPSMEGNPRIAGVARSGLSGAYEYSVIGPFGSAPTGAESPGNRPITHVSWWDAARFANWMSNGQPTGLQGPTTTEDGAYPLNGLEGIKTPPTMNATNPNTGAVPLYRIPTENEWYKAAYYSPVLGSGAGGYYTYATQSNTAPGNVIGDAANQANFFNDVYSVTRSSAILNSQNHLTNVGAFTSSPSFYGTFDQSGNVFEWSDLPGDPYFQAQRGADWNGVLYGLSSASRQLNGPWMEVDQLGFRLGSPVPGPATTTINVPFGQITTQSQAGYPLLFGTIPVAKTGPGTLVLDAANSFSSSLAVNEGTTVAANVQALGTATLDVAAGAAFAISPAIGAANPLRVSELGEIDGTIDVNTGRFSLPASGASPAAELRSLLISGRSGGTWNGAAGIVSTAAAASGGTRTVGYVVSADGSAVVAFAASGDVNLDGQVDVFDLVGVNSSGTYGSGQPAVWSQGDFNYDGLTNVFDLVGINTAGAFGQGNYLPVTSSATAVTAVPEPSAFALALAGLACGGLSFSRRRTRP